METEMVPEILVSLNQMTWLWHNSILWSLVVVKASSNTRQWYLLTALSPRHSRLVLGWMTVLGWGQSVASW